MAAGNDSCNVRRIHNMLLPPRTELAGRRTQPDRARLPLWRPAESARFNGAPDTGLFYLLGLNRITATKPGTIDGAIDVRTFNAIWFSTPVVSLLLSIGRPQLAQRMLATINATMHRYQDRAITALIAAVGVYFVAKGLLTLLF